MKKLIVPTVAAAAFLAAASYATAATAGENWDALCSKCHAADGSGNTKIGKKLKVKDYTDAKTIGDHSDADLVKDILEGVKVGGKEVMKGYSADLKADEAQALVAHIRSFAKK
jgi:cytochrome c6